MRPERVQNPPDEPCVFPDMLQALESTPQGRLSQRLRFGTEMRPGKPEAITADLLVYVGSLLGTTIPYFRSPVAGLPMVHW